jgi:outer membrane protein assembly factor BamB
MAFVKGLALASGLLLWGLVIGAGGASFGQEPKLSSFAQSLGISPDDWPWWRGPGRMGEAVAGQKLPAQWDDNTNIRWRTAVPGRGHGSPTVLGNKIFLATGDEVSGAQLVCCFARENGQMLWQTEVHSRGGMWKNAKSTAASTTIATDGKQLFVAFPNDGGLHASSLDLAGKIIWQSKLSDYVEHQGYGASPALYGSMVILSADNKGGGAIVALDRQTGNEVWRRERPAIPNYSSPSILHVAGRDQVILTGCNLVTSFDPTTGETLWEIAGATEECVTTTVTDGNLVYSSGGYPRNHVAAIAADGSGQIVWESDNRLYVPSMVIRDGNLYGVLDAGIAFCWEAKSGKELWRGRLGGTFSASPVLVGNTIYVTNEEGETYLFAASPDKLQVLSKNKLGDEVFATATICGGAIYQRVAHYEGTTRQEYLYCIANDL